MPPNSLWEQVSSQLEKELSTLFYNTWIAQLKPIAWQDGRFVLGAPNSFIKDNVENLYAARITALLETATDESVELVVTEPSDPAYRDYRTEPKEAKPAEPPPAPKPEYDQTLITRYTFENFVRGKSNELAYAGARAVADEPGKVYNPLFIYGGVGLGKTHLINATGLSIQQRFPNLRVVYISSEKFTNELVASIREQKNEAFRNQYRNVDVLLVDDIQFIAGKDATQEEFFHTFNHLYNANKQIILSSDRPPREISTLEDRLRSRFEMGLITDIGAPDYETRVAILQEKMKMQVIPVPEEVIHFIATHVQSNIRELEGTLMRVTAYANLKREPVSLALAQEALENMIEHRSKSPLSGETIIRMMAEEFNLRPEDFTSRNRSKKIAYPRQIAMYLTRELTDLSLVKIAGIFEKDHSTVIYGIDKIKGDMEEDPELAAKISALRAKLKP